MRNPAKLLTTAASVIALFGTISVMPVTASADEASVIEQGKQIAFNRKKGNCLACHQIEGGKLAGNIGPPLVAMKARFPDKAKLRAQIYDPRKNNPNTIMPPFGPHHILTDDEIDKVTEFVYSL
ncbi:MAG: sulfur oxidation c-type cytochrome SoxX [Gammaproteobacteria bacterium]|nr:MAG: sulfur oxidation c-type cytochrome SoxX [Gammaproteobacteria bacterium]